MNKKMKHPYVNKRFSKQAVEGNKKLQKKHYIIVKHDLGASNTMPIKKDKPTFNLQTMPKEVEGRRSLSLRKRKKKSKSPTHLGNNLETILCKHEIACFRKLFKLIYA